MDMEVSLQPNGLLRLVTPDGKAYDDLADDEVVRLAAKWAKFAASRTTISRVDALRTSAPTPSNTSKCANCGSTKIEVRRQRMGVSGSCRDPFHEMQVPMRDLSHCERGPDVVVASGSATERTVGRTPRSSRQAETHLDEGTR